MTRGAVVAAFLLAAVVAVAFEGVLVFRQPPPVRAEGSRTYVLTDLQNGTALGETFRPQTNGLDSVSLVFTAGEPSSLRLDCRLLTWDVSVNGNWATVHAWTETFRVKAEPEWHRFDFPPVADSDRKVYQFQIRQLAASAGETTPGHPAAVGVFGSLDDAMATGNLIVGQEQVTDRDLYFMATARDSAFDRFRRYTEPNMPRVLRPVFLQLSVLAVLNLGILMFAYQMIVSGPEQFDRAQPKPLAS
jgi:hypothetical protein